MSKYLEIPISSSTFHGSGNNWRDVGFGYDAVKNDFKVVRKGRISSVPMFEVFSTRDWNWMNVVTDHLGQFVIGSEGIVMKGGAINWIIKRYINDHNHVWEVLVFDCGGGRFKTMELPREVNQVQQRSVAIYMQLVVYRGMLSVEAILRDLLDRTDGVRSVMEEYGVKSSWNKSGWGEPHLSALKGYSALRKGSRYKLCVIQPSMLLMDATSG